VKKLYIIRHAKSSWSDLSLNDFDRPLNKRGKRDAPVMGDRFVKRAIKPDSILSSPAKRAKETAKMIAKSISYKNKILFDENIYEASLKRFESILRNLDDKDKISFLVAHNSTLNMFVYEYVGLDENVPTCGVVGIEFDCDKWSEISPKNAKLILFDYPKKDFISKPIL